jgi:hypothetical protein
VHFPSANDNLIRINCDCLAKLTDFSGESQTLGMLAVQHWTPPLGHPTLLEGTSVQIFKILKWDGWVPENCARELEFHVSWNVSL